MHPSCGDLSNKKSLVHKTVPSVLWDKTVTPAVPPMLALMRPLCTYDHTLRRITAAATVAPHAAAIGLPSRVHSPFVRCSASTVRCSLKASQMGTPLGHRFLDGVTLPRPGADCKPHFHETARPRQKKICARQTNVPDRRSGTVSDSVNFRRRRRRSAASARR